MSPADPLLPEGPPPRELPPSLPPPLPTVEVVERPQRALPPKPYPGFWQAAGLFALWLAVSIAVVLPAAVADTIQNNKHQELTTHPANLGLATIASTTTVFLIARQKSGRRLKELFAWVPVPPIIFLAAAGMVVSIVTLGVVSFMWIERFFPGWVPKQDYGFSKSRWIALFLIVIVAPFCEEVLFRGIFLRGFSRRYGVARGIALSSLFFAIAHGSLARLPHTFALGAALGWLYSGTRSLWVSVATHLFNNLVAGAFLFFARPAGEKSTTPAFIVPPFHWSELLLTALAATILLVCIQAIRVRRLKMADDWETKIGEPSQAGSGRPYYDTQVPY